MNPISKTAIAVVAVALVIVIGLIVISANTKQAEQAQTAAQATVQPTIEVTAEPAKAPEEEAQNEAQADSDMYEGALAGLTEEEIGKLAMAEEQHNGEETGEQIAEEDGTTNKSVAGVAD